MDSEKVASQLAASSRAEYTIGGVRPIAVYVHVPFCPTKCGYCDFNSYAMTGEIIARTVNAIRSEILGSPYRGWPAKTIFFGGGTPTFISGTDLASLLDAVREVHPPFADCEVTSEANPGTVDASKFEAMVAAGFNRISLGVQSFDAGDLVRLGRVHSVSEGEVAVKSARNAGFSNINIDLMFALPNQSLPAWRENLKKALEMRTDHLSLYCLTLEPNTSFYKLASQGKLTQPDDESQSEMYDTCAELLQSAGLQRYEISNYAKPGFECRHNLCYWRCEEYAAYGPGAVARIGNERTMRWKQPARYCESVEAGGDLFQEREQLSESDLHRERVMLGLRLREGVASGELDPGAIARTQQRGWIEQIGDRVVLTRLGRHFCNQAIVELF